MKYTLFLDDLRDPTWDLIDVLVARNVHEAEVLVKDLGVPSCLSLDHDLGKNEPSAMAFLHWLVDDHLNGLIDLRLIEEVIVHSANPVGADNLAGLWDGFAKHIGSDVRANKRPRI